MQKREMTVKRGIKLDRRAKDGGEDDRRVTEDHGHHEADKHRVQRPRRIADPRRSRHTLIGVSPPMPIQMKPAEEAKGDVARQRDGVTDVSRGEVVS
jgi:hypothetical protein